MNVRGFPAHPLAHRHPILLAKTKTPFTISTNNNYTHKRIIVFETTDKLHHFFDDSLLFRIKIDNTYNEDPNFHVQFSKKKRACNQLWEYMINGQIQREILCTVSHTTAAWDLLSFYVYHILTLVDISYTDKLHHFFDDSLLFLTKIDNTYNEDPSFHLLFSKK